MNLKVNQVSLLAYPPLAYGYLTGKCLQTNIASIIATITPNLEKRIDAIHVAHYNPCPQ